MGHSAREIADAFQSAGVSVQFKGSPTAEAARIRSAEEATGDSLVFIERPKDVPAALKSAAVIVVLPAGELADMVGSSARALIGVSDVRRVMPLLLSMFDQRAVPPPGVHSTAVIGKGTKVGQNVSIGPYVVLGENCRIGDGAILDAHVSVGPDSRVGEGTRIFSGVRIYDGIQIGSRCRIHCGTVIGSDGYGYVSSAEGHQKVPQIGGVCVEDDVELGAGVTIDRGTIGDTVIGRGTKIDNLVHIAHNVRVGAYCLIVAQSGVAGSTRLGNWTVLAAQSGVAGHVSIGDRTMVGARSGVTKSLPPGQTVSGFPARPHPEEKRIKVCMGRLPELVRDTYRLKAAVFRLSKRLSAIERTAVSSV